jgi:hypothetical protein
MHTDTFSCPESPRSFSPRHVINGEQRLDDTLRFEVIAASFTA